MVGLEACEPRSEFEDLLLVELGSPAADDLDGRTPVLVQDVAQRLKRLVASPLDLVIAL